MRPGGPEKVRGSRSAQGQPTTPRAEVSEEGDNILDGLLTTGTSTYGVFIKVNCPAEVRDSVMLQHHTPVQWPWGTTTLACHQALSLGE